MMVICDIAKVIATIDECDEREFRRDSIVAKGTQYYKPHGAPKGEWLPIGGEGII